MSRYSAFDQHTGRWGEIVWLPRHVPTTSTKQTPRYLVKVGERSVGEVWKMDRGWHPIAYGDNLRGPRAVDDFRTRWAATVYILNIAVRPPRED